MFDDEEWKYDCEILEDIVLHMSDLNLKLQGKGKHIGDLSFVKSFQS